MGQRNKAVGNVSVLNIPPKSLDGHMLVEGGICSCKSGRLGYFSNRPDLHKEIPPSTSMFPSKLLGGMLSNDICPTALLLLPTIIQKMNRYFRDELDMLEEEIEQILKGDCWQHMRNIICNGIELELRIYLHNLLEDDLAIMQCH